VPFTYPGKGLDYVFANGQTGAEVLAAGCTFADTEGPGDVDVCDPATGDIITVSEDEADQYLPADDPACEDTPPPICTEDMPCWDCETMGNKECGPVVVPPVVPPVKPPTVVPSTPEVGVPSTPADTL